MNGAGFAEDGELRSAIGVFSKLGADTRAGDGVRHEIMMSKEQGGSRGKIFNELLGCGREGKEVILNIGKLGSINKAADIEQGGYSTSGPIKEG